MHINCNNKYNMATIESIESIPIRLRQNCKFCHDNDRHIPYSTENICSKGCKFHSDCMNYERYAPIFKYGSDEEMPEPIRHREWLNGDECHGHDIPWHNLKRGPFIWLNSDGSKRVLHGPYKEYNDRGHVIRSMNYNMGEIVGTFKIYGNQNILSMEQETVLGGKVHGLRTIHLYDGTKITENWRYGIIHGTRTIKKADNTGALIEEYDNGYIVSKVEETYSGGRIICKEITVKNEEDESLSKWTWIKRKLFHH